MNVKTESTSSPKRLARIAGVFYLLVALFGGFAEGFGDPKMYVAGNAAATAANVLADPGLVRMIVVAHLVNAVFFILTAMAFYILFQHVNKSVAMAMLICVALSAGITTLNAVFQFEGLQVATNSSYVDAFGAAGSNALVLLLLDIQHYGTLSAQVFFGLWLAPLGYLAYKSGLFPKALGVTLVAATVYYLVHLITAFLVPDFHKQIQPFILIVIIAEVWLLGYLLIVGVRNVKPGKNILAAATV
ncbi:MAG: DUF4386 domain-containing protein [Anaerolineae bacterium]|uniref:DUF4386 domain-containing protein n=1 Tax=Candidatus Amarolinea dominans TaxID=3140696 RepID=UPI001DBE74A2|nr:DUF4386 domain-containing protein [Anaerolineae bacterium]MBK7199261.1 DUF4386 domain-containing protein [Anaerolineae bacterium]